MNSSTPTEVIGESEEEVTQVKRTRPFLFFFTVEWWETVSVNSVGRDIHIKTEHPIRHIYLNGERIKS